MGVGGGGDKTLGSTQNKALFFFPSTTRHWCHWVSPSVRVVDEIDATHHLIVARHFARDAICTVLAGRGST